jgi:hypothetical protein
VSYYFELLADMPQGLESWVGDCGDQEGDGFLGRLFLLWWETCRS